jgi:hypothetical protein
MDPTSNPSIWAKVVDKALDKLPFDKVYEDLLQPGFKKVGEALETIIDTTNTLLFPIAWLNGRRAIFLKNNLLRYQNKLNDVAENVIPVPDLISIPIIEKLSLTTQHELTEAFINLLTKASFASTVHFVHPAFSAILSSISSDEAKVLFALKDKDFIPSVNSEVIYIRKGETFSVHELNYTDLRGWVQLDFPDNLPMYIENLFRLKLFESKYDRSLRGVDSEYEKLIKALTESADSKFENHRPLKIEKGMVYFSNFGRGFVDACIKDIDELKLDSIDNSR